MTTPYPTKQLPGGLITSPAPQQNGQMTKEQLQTLTIPKLKEILKRQGKTVGGNKDVLIDRILLVTPITPASTLTQPVVVTSPKKLPQLGALPKLGGTGLQPQPQPTKPVQIPEPVQIPTKPELIAYDRYSQPELLVLVENIYGEKLPMASDKQVIIDFIKSKGEEKILEFTGPGPQIGALSPVVTSPTRMPLLPPISGKPSSPKIMSPVATSPTRSPVQLPPMPQVEIPKSPVVSPRGTLPQLKPGAPSQPIILPEVTSPTVVLPASPPVKLRAAISPEPMPTVILPGPLGSTVSKPAVKGVIGVNELPAITAPTPKPIAPEIMGGPGIAMPLVPQVVPTQGIKLPPISGGTQLPMPIPTTQLPKTELADIPEFQLPGAELPVMIPTGQIVPTQIAPVPTQPLPSKVGPGGLPIETDLATLNQLRREVDTAIHINPNANFQKKVEAPQTVTILPPLPSVNLPLLNVLPPKPVTTPTNLPSVVTTPTNLPPVVTTPTNIQPVVLPSPGKKLPLTAQLPTGRPTGITTKPIHIPKVKATAPVPGTPRINLPMTSTVLKPIPLTSPEAAPQKLETGLAVAYTPQQQVVENIMKIDPSRLNAGRAKKDDDSYTVSELRTLAGSLNLTKSGNKKDLVDRITAAIKKINPGAFN